MAPLLPPHSLRLGVAVLLWLAVALPLHASPPASAAQESRAAPNGPAAPETSHGADSLLQLLVERDLIGGTAPAPTSAQRWREDAAASVVSALNFLGLPYRRGGDSAESGFDCSGFTRHVFEASLGLALPRRAELQARSAALQAVPRNALQPGDLVFFNTLRRAFSHVGIYIGEDRFIHAPRSGAEVRIEDMRAAYWARRFDGARRAAPH